MGGVQHFNFTLSPSLSLSGSLSGSLSHFWQVLRGEREVPWHNVNVRSSRSAQYCVRSTYRCTSIPFFRPPPALCISSESDFRFTFSRPPIPGAKPVRACFLAARRGDRREWARRAAKKQPRCTESICLEKKKKAIPLALSPPLFYFARGVKAISEWRRRGLYYETRRGKGRGWKEEEIRKIGRLARTLIEKKTAEAKKIREEEGGKRRGGFGWLVKPVPRA